MTGRMLGVTLLATIALPAAVRSQGSLAQAAERVRRAWLEHDAQAIVGQSAKVVLQIGDAAPSAPLERAQATELLRRHLQGSAERAVTLAVVQEDTAGAGYVELDRRYVVSGTRDERRETIVLRFAKPGAEWLLSELRSAR